MAALRELNIGVFHIARDVAALAHVVIGKVQVSGASIEDGERWRSQLVAKCKVEERMEAVYADVLARHEISKDDLVEARRLFDSVEEVCGFSEGVRAMLESAFCGLPPRLPHVRIPPELSEDGVLAIHRRFREQTVSVALETVQREGIHTADGLGQAMASAAQAVEADMFQKDVGLYGIGGALYLTAKAMHSDSPDFAARLAQLDDEHKVQAAKQLSAFVHR